MHPPFPDNMILVREARSTQKSHTVLAVSVQQPEIASFKPKPQTCCARLSERVWRQHNMSDLSICTTFVEQQFGHAIGRVV